MYDDKSINCGLNFRCPVPTCKTPRRKVKQLRYFPSKFQDLPSNIKESILSDISKFLNLYNCIQSKSKLEL